MIEGRTSMTRAAQQYIVILLTINKSTNFFLNLTINNIDIEQYNILYNILGPQYIVEQPCQ